LFYFENPKMDKKMEQEKSMLEMELTRLMQKTLNLENELNSIILGY
jgi:hypothetical protein